MKKLHPAKIAIPGCPEGSGRESMNTPISDDFEAPCPWIPGSRALPAPRNDALFAAVREG